MQFYDRRKKRRIGTALNIAVPLTYKTVGVFSAGNMISQ